MEKNLKDYIQYYIGCRCLNTWFDENNPNYDDGWKLIGLVPDNPKPYGLENSINTTWTDSIKPILRNLKDMEEDEGKELAKLQHPPKYHEDIEVLLINEKRVHYTDGTMAYGDGWSDLDEFYVRFEQLNPAQFHYLLKQGFDLFGLLDAGLAVDEKTLTK